MKNKIFKRSLSLLLTIVIATTGLFSQMAMAISYSFTEDHAMINNEIDIVGGENSSDNDAEKSKEKESIRLELFLETEDLDPEEEEVVKKFLADGHQVRSVKNAHRAANIFDCSMEDLLQEEQGNKKERAIFTGGVEASQVDSISDLAELLSISAAGLERSANDTDRSFADLLLIVETYATSNQMQSNQMTSSTLTSSNIMSP
jgi:hypothetical protein